MYDLRYRKNLIKALPDKITLLEGLRELNLKGNPITAKQVAAIRTKLPYCKVIY